MLKISSPINGLRDVLSRRRNKMKKTTDKAKQVRILADPQPLADPVFKAYKKAKLVRL